MKEEVCDPARPTGPPRLNRDEQFQAYARLIERASKAYIECRAAEPIGAANWDQSKPRRGRTPVVIHFTVDVKNAVEYGLKDRADRVELIRAFVMAADGFTTIGPSERTLIWKLGPVLKRRGLNPTKYFSGASRHVEHRGVSSISDTAFMATATAMAEEVTA